MEQTGCLQEDTCARPLLERLDGLPEPEERRLQQELAAQDLSEAEFTELLQLVEFHNPRLLMRLSRKRRG